MRHLRLPAHPVRTVLARGNLIAGIAVGCYLIPQAMAYGTLAGIGATAGLAMALIPLLLYPLLGRSRTLSLGPESTSALMAAVTVAPIAFHHPGQEIAIMATLTFLVGALMVAARIIRAGAIADLLSRPVLLGYMTGIAILMVCSQLPKLLNVPVDAHNLVTLAGSAYDLTVSGSVHLLTDSVLNVPNVIVAAVTLAVVLVCRRISPRLPGAPIALLVAGIVGAVIDAPTIGTVTSAIPTTLTFLDPRLIGELILPALAVTIVAYSESTACARAFADRGTRLDDNRELVAWGSIGMLNSFTGAYPASASSSRTAIAVASGASNRFYSWTVLAVVVALPLTIGGVLEQIPVASLVGIVMYAATHLVDVAGLRGLARFRFRELGIAIVTTIGVTTLGVLPGLGIAIALSIAELLLRLMRPHEGVLGFVPGVAGMHDVDDHPDAEQVPGLLVYRYDAPLFFANSHDFARQVLDAVDQQQDVTWVILNMEANVEVDASGLEALESVHDELTVRGVHLVLARVKNDLRIPMERYGTLATIGERNIYPTLPTAVDAYCAATGQTRPGADADEDDDIVGVPV